MFLLMDAAFFKDKHNLTSFQPRICSPPSPRDPLTAQYSVHSGRLRIVAVAVIKLDLGEKSRKTLHGPQQEKGHLKR